MGSLTNTNTNIPIEITKLKYKYDQRSSVCRMTRLYDIKIDEQMLCKRLKFFDLGIVFKQNNAYFSGIAVKAA